MSYGTCKNCGCTDDNACMHPDHGPCYWIDEEHEMCSHCYVEEIANDPATERAQPDFFSDLYNIVFPDPPDKTVECCRCGDIHQWSERLRVPEGCWEVYRCPICADESYFTCESLNGCES